MNTNTIDTEKTTTPEPGAPQPKGKRPHAKKAKPAKKLRVIVGSLRPVLASKGMRELLILAIAVPLLAQAPEPRIARLYVFGDSYSDNGAGYLDSDGPTAVAYLAPRLGFELKPATAITAASDSLNFAVSGAQTGRGPGQKVKDALLGRGMMDQVDDFVARVKAQLVEFDAKTTVFFLAGGLNDGRLPSTETVANLEAEIRKLYEAGARRFRVALLPTAIPAFRVVAQRLNPKLRGIPRGSKAAIARGGDRTQQLGRVLRRRDAESVAVRHREHDRSMCGTRPLR